MILEGFTTGLLLVRRSRLKREQRDTVFGRDIAHGSSSTEFWVSPIRRWSDKDLQPSISGADSILSWRFLITSGVVPVARTLALTLAGGANENSGG